MTRADEIDVFARTIWAESRGEPLSGQIAVAWVILNRLRDARKRWPQTLTDVCKQPKQFSCWNVKDPNLVALSAVSFADRAFVRSFGIACSVFVGDWPDPTNGANHYLRTDWLPRVKWWKKMTKTAEIGNQTFFEAA